MMRYGGGCNCCGCSLVVTVKGCVGGASGQNVVGATVTATLGGSSYTGTTNSSGVATISVPAGTYSVSVTATGYCTQSKTVVVTCPGGVGTTITLPLSAVPVSVSGCTTGLSGATVTVQDSGGTTVFTGTTDASGNVTATVPCTYPYTVTASKSRFASSSTTISSLTQAATTCSLSFALAADTGYYCLICCNDPVPSTLHLSDPLAGSVTLTNAGTQDPGCTFASTSRIWTGSASVSSPAHPCGTTCAAKTVTVSYTFWGTLSQFCGVSCSGGGAYWLTVSYPSTATGTPAVYCPDPAGVNTNSFTRTSSAYTCPTSFSATFPGPTCGTSQPLYNGGTFTLTE